MTNSDYIDNPALFVNIPSQAESQMHNLEQAMGGIGLYVDASKTECMCFKQKLAIFTQSSNPLKFVDQFTYLGSSISSSENNVNIRFAKA